MKPTCIYPTNHLSFPALAGALLFAALSGGVKSEAASTPTGYGVVQSHTPPLGGEPRALFEGSDGHLYVASEAGGTHYEGVIFKLNRNGSGLKVLHHFGGGSLKERTPQGLIEASDGALYGTTKMGGLAGGVTDRFGIPGYGNGTVFRLSRDGSNFRVLHRFTGIDGEGSEPWAGVVEGKDGALYGTTLHSGRLIDGQLVQGGGVVFKLNKDGSGYQVLHRFGMQPDDGFGPFAGLLAGSDGNLYGVTDGGGASGPRNGTVFKLAPDGSGYSILHFFPAAPGDGRMPRTGLLESADGALLGTTQAGGTKDFGTVFRLNKNGTGYRVLHQFTGSSGHVMDPAGRIEATIDGADVKIALRGDGVTPGALVQARGGVLYGTTEHQGRNGAGSLFRLNPDGNGYATLHHFNSSDADGKGNAKPLTAGSDGALYGATGSGGADDRGTIFRLLTPASR